MKLSMVALSLVFVYYLAAVQVPKILISTTKASVAKRLSVSDSYVIGEKILAKADGEDKCLVNVFLLDEDGKGISGKGVDLVGMKDIKAKNNLSDKDGKIGFEIISKEEGQFRVESPMLNKGVTLTFRN